MIVVQFAKGALACQVDDFPKDAKRSCVGSLHVRPSATKVVTQAELEHLQKLKIPLRVLVSETEKPKAEPVDEPTVAGIGDIDVRTDETKAEIESDGNPDEEPVSEQSGLEGGFRRKKKKGSR